MEIIKTLLVLTDLGPAAERTRRYAALLAGPLNARVVLLHVYQKAAITIETEGGKMVDYLSAEQTERLLRDLAATMPVPATVEVTEGVFAEALHAAVDRHQPLLLLAGFRSTSGYLDGLLANRSLPLLRNTAYPVVFVPEDARLTPPTRVTLAVDGEPFGVVPDAIRMFAEILHAWSARTTLLHVNTPLETVPHEKVVQTVLDSQVLPATHDATYRQPTEESPAKGIQRTLVIHPANLLVLIARHRSFLGQLFHRSVTASVLRHATIPVLLLPDVELAEG